MVTIEATLASVNGKPSDVWNIRCLSTDAKPIPAPNGSDLLEMDTGKVYVFDAESKSWLEL